MADHAQLLLPDPALSGCLFAAILRDTRGLRLTDAQRFNHFPASPLVALTLTLTGETRMVDPATNAPQTTALAPVTLSGPHRKPTHSWNPGPVQALSIGIYPDAWTILTGQPADDLADRFTDQLPAALSALLDRIPPTDDPLLFWRGLQSELLPRWQVAQTGAIPGYRHRLSNWSRALVTRAALSGPGRSLRSVERRLRRLTGHNRQSLEFFATIENLHAQVVETPGTTPADTAYAAGFADQSHMGRIVKRATGFSPARLAHLIETDETFWCYRILGERF